MPPVQVWLKDEIEDGYCTSYMLLWLYLYPVRLALRYIGRSCRRYARADEGTIRHMATIHGLQVVLQGTFLGLLSAYLLFVDGISEGAQV